MQQNHILFLSANDFKEKSIQVLRKTPEAFVKEGWNVTYIVARDYSKQGNYYYENEINLNGVKIIRFPFSLTKLRNRFTNKLVQTILTQIAGYIVILQLFVKAKKEIKNNKIDVVYGYEVHGVCANILLKKFKYLKNIKIVSRFQGTWIGKYLEDKNYLKLILNFEDVYSLKSYADLCIMTNDGTKGKYALEKLKSRAFKNLKFWTNGVDNQLIPEEQYADLVEKYNPNKDKLIITSVSRLEEWKRVDRIILIISNLVNKHNFTKIKYLLIGEGGKIDEYKNLVKQNKLENYIEFIGAIDNKEVKKYLNLAEVFFSTYNLSNVGNPLLEAIRAHKIIFTLNNGDTSSWIHHNENGFIYDVNENLIEKMSLDLLEISTNKELKNKITQNIKKTETEKLWTWEERFVAEIYEVTKLVANEN